MCLIDERLKRDRLRLQRRIGRTGDDSRGAGDVRYRSTVLDSMRNFQSEFLPICGILRVLGFIRIGQEPAFHQDGGNSRVSQNEKAAASDTAISRRRAARDIIMNRRCEGQTLRAVKVGFDAARATPRRGIEVDADENRVAVGVSDGDASTQRNEDVLVSRHHDAVAVLLEH